MLEQRAVDLPLGPLRLRPPRLREPGGRPRDVAPGDPAAQVAAEDPARARASRSSRPRASTTRPSSSTSARTGGRSSPSWDSPRRLAATGSSTPTRRSGSSPRTRSSSRATQYVPGPASNPRPRTRSAPSSFTSATTSGRACGCRSTATSGTAGRTSLNGVENAATLQKNSRVGVTASFPAHPAPVDEGLLRPGRLHPLRRRLPASSRRPGSTPGSTGRSELSSVGGPMDMVEPFVALVDLPDDPGRAVPPGRQPGPHRVGEDPRPARLPPRAASSCRRTGRAS